jgi:hypothetical protein
VPQRAPFVETDTKRRGTRLAAVPLSLEVIMASTLKTTGESGQVTRKGHGTDALGPSDSSDTGSDVVGGPGLDTQEGLPFQQGTTSDPDVDRMPTTAGPDLGDANLDSDSDRYGTGERAAVGRDSTEPTDETLTEYDPDQPESLDVMDDAAFEVAPDDVPSGDDPEAEVEAAETVEKRRRINGARRRASR